jgi:hypothetical protein
VKAVVKRKYENKLFDKIFDNKITEETSGKFRIGLLSNGYRGLFFTRGKAGWAWGSLVTI